MPPKARAAHRYGVIMQPLPASPHESGGVCNPGGATGPDGQFYLFPRLVQSDDEKTNYSRIGLARVTRHPDGRPAGVQRLGVALEPTAHFDANGCEDPRVVYAPTIRAYVMTYTGLGSDGIPRICFAFSTDLVTWIKAGPVAFQRQVLPSLMGIAARTLEMPEREDDVATVPNKDGVFLPEPVVAPDGRLSWALIHRPMFRYQPGTAPTLYISYCPTVDLASGRAVFGQHRVLCTPQQPWEKDRMGAGCVIATETAWMLIYHGVEARRYWTYDDTGEEATTARLDYTRKATSQTARTYRAGILLLDKTAPHKVTGRTRTPILEPRTKRELSGVVDNVVFPTAIQHRYHGSDGIDLYYGMADSAIGCARFDFPAPLPAPKKLSLREQLGSDYYRWGNPGFHPFSTPSRWPF